MVEEMLSFAVPSGDGAVTGHIARKNLLGIYRSHLPSPAPDPAAEVAAALDHPIGSRPPAELAVRAASAVIIASDHTRPVPSKFLIPPLLAHLRRGNPAIRITILVATGCHRAPTREELVRKFGEEIVAREEIVIHDSRDDDALMHAGTLPSGGELLVNRRAMECDLLLAEGFIEPHFFAGFSGGRKSVLPGIAGRATVLANHCGEFIAHPQARTGILDGNPVHNDMLYAARQAKLAFILNVVLDPEKRIVRAFAGSAEAAHRAGTDFLTQYARVSVPEADIVVTGNGGAPLDQNVYQCVKGMSCAEAVVRPGGVIVLCAGCSDGHGGESFFRHLRDHTPEELLRTIAATPRSATVPDQWQYQILARILTRASVIMVTGKEHHAMLKAMHLEAAETVDEALAPAFARCGEAAKVAVIPDGVSVIPAAAQ